MSATQPDPRVGIQSRLESASNYNAWIAGQARAVLGRRVLDAGCGAGNVTSALLDRELVVAVDEWPEFVQGMETRFGDRSNVRVLRLDLADPALVEALRPFGLDSAMCVNVLEHVEDHRAALGNLAAVLPAGAPLFLLVPALPGLYGEMDRIDHHFRRYTKGSLRATVAGLPWRVEELRYMNVPGVLAWFVYGRVLRRATVSEGSYGLYDRIVPALARGERRWPPPLGQSLVAVLRKTA